MGSKYRPEVSSGSSVKDMVLDLTELGSYWRSIFSDRGLSNGNTDAYFDESGDLFSSFYS